MVRYFVLTAHINAVYPLCPALQTVLLSLDHETTDRLYWCPHSNVHKQYRQSSTMKSSRTDRRIENEHEIDHRPSTHCLLFLLYGCWLPVARSFTTNAMYSWLMFCLCYGVLHQTVQYILTRLWQPFLRLGVQQKYAHRASLCVVKRILRGHGRARLNSTHSYN